MTLAQTISRIQGVALSSFEDFKNGLLDKPRQSGAILKLANLLPVTILEKSRADELFQAQKQMDFDKLPVCEKSGVMSNGRNCIFLLSSDEKQND